LNTAATVFSKRYEFSLEKLMTIPQLEESLRESMAFIGRALACNGVIAGHIKILARLPELAVDRFLFLSLTRLGQIDVAPSKYWSQVSGVSLDRLELHVNVLIFGYTFSQIEAVVNDALKNK
jgi:hypothetical protein